MVIASFETCIATKAGSCVVFMSDLLCITEYSTSGVPRMRAPAVYRGETMFKTISVLVIALAIAASGVALARYAEADDAPGGVVIGGALVLGAIVVGVRVLQQRAT